MVPVQVFQVCPVMDPVMGGGIKDIFQWGRQSLDRLGMDPELVDEADGLHHEHNDGMKAQHRHPAPEDKGACQISCPGLSQGGSQVIAFGRMVNYVRCPE